MIPHKKEEKSPFKWWRLNLKFIHLQYRYSQFNFNLAIYCQLFFFFFKLLFLSSVAVFSLSRQSGWRGRPPLPAGLTSSWDQKRSHKSERFGLRLTTSEAQCPGQAGANTCCVAAVGPESPRCHTYTTEPTCWSEFFHFSISQNIFFSNTGQRLLCDGLATCPGVFQPHQMTSTLIRISRKWMDEE